MVVKTPTRSKTYRAGGVVNPPGFSSLDALGLVTGFWLARRTAILLEGGSQPGTSVNPPVLTATRSSFQSTHSAPQDALRQSRFCPQEVVK